jgi:glutathione S-transferase
MYTLHIANKNYSSWSLRPWVLMKALGIPFEEASHVFTDGGSYSQFRSFSPTGLVPLLVDGDTKVWESLAIVEYLYEAEPRVWPKDKVARAWARSAASEMHGGFSALRNACSMTVGVRITMNEISPALQANLDRLTELWSEGLLRWGGPFLTGKEYTAVDAFFCPVAFRIQTYGLKLGNAAMGYARTLLSLPAMKEWYEAALKETAREPSHEDEIAMSGKTTVDYRATA